MTWPVFVYCLKGLDISRSAALSLRARGLAVRYLIDGIEAWRATGKPLQSAGAVSESGHAEQPGWVGRP